MKVNVITKASKIPKPIYAPNICTGGIGVNINEKKPAEEVSDVNIIGLNKCSTTVVITSSACCPGLYLSENSDRICTESTTAIGIKKMAIIDDMICTVKPIPISAPMVMMTVAIATTIGAVIRVILWKNTKSNMKIIKPAAGAAMPI